MKRLASIAVVAAAVVAPLWAGSAQAAAAGRTAGTVTVWPEEGEGTATRTLTCSPVGGTHPHAGRACAAIKQVDGDLSRIDSHDPVSCTKELRVTLVKFEGTIDGHPVTFENRFDNDCIFDKTASVLWQI